MAEPSKRRSTTKRLISLVDCGKSSSQRIITLNERVCEYFPHGPDHTAILHKAIRLAWNMVFSVSGARMTAQSLVESWLASTVHPAPSPAEMDLVLTKAVAEVENFQKSHPVTVYMDSNVQTSPEVECKEQVKIRFDFFVRPRDTCTADEKMSQHAAEAQSRSLVPDASLDIRFRRYRHVFYIAALIVNGLQQAINKVALRPEELASDPELSTSTCTNSSHLDRIRAAQQDDRIRNQKSIAAGWRFEEMMFGGQMARLVKSSRASDPDSISNGISGVAVMMASEGVPGYRIISDEVIKAIVEGADCDRYFPLRLQHTNGFVAGVHPNAVYRIGDGSRKLYGRLLPDYCSRRVVERA